MNFFIRYIVSILTYVVSRDCIHQYIVPGLHAVLWSAALYFSFSLISNESKDASQVPDNLIEAMQFISIFIVLFLEILIVLLDIYVTCKANYLSPKFILFTILLLFIVIVTSICSCIAITDINTITTKCNFLLYIIISSAILKLIENLLINNIKWYIITDPQIRDARGIYTRHQIN